MSLEMLGFIELDAITLLKAAKEYKKYILRKNYKYVKEGAEFLVGKPKKTGLIYYLIGKFKKPEVWTYREAFEFLNRHDDEWYCGKSLVRRRYSSSQDDADTIINACKTARNGKVILNISENANVIAHYRKIENERQNNG